MTDQLRPVWNQIEWLHSAGISLIPVRDRQQGDRPAKTPYQGWKQSQITPVTLPDLWKQMDEHNTTAVAIIAGKVSGNLEIIDIDVKYKPGIDAVILSDLKSIYPALFAKLRIHKTPSGGYHILYRCATGTVPGNAKLAGRYKSPDELTTAPKPSQVNFIETRGEGGYAVAPPSLNYTIHLDNPIPVISWEDRCSIITLMRSYSEIVEIAQPYKPTKSDRSYYDENPFEHFNSSPEAETILQDGGWKFVKQSNLFIWFTRPGKDTGISASFNKQKRVYFIFTSSTEFDESKGYNPATVLSILQHGGDRKQTYRSLVQKGYGKIRPEVEARITKSKATTGHPLPPNVSQQGKAEYASTIITLQTTYPYGVFWEDGDKPGLILINREKLYAAAEGLGFRLHGSDPVRIVGYIVTKQSEREFFDGMKSYIKEEDADDYNRIANAFESFVQRNGTFTITRLPLLNPESIVRDTSNSAYKFYNNGYLYITAQKFTFNTYDTLSGLIWYHDILQRPYIAGPESGKYIDFLRLALPYDEQTDHIRKIIGYLSHQFKDETVSYITVLTESCPDPKNGGGSGKNIFCSLFGHTTTFKSIPGTQVRYDEKFMQSWNGERIFCISDPEKKFDFIFLKEPSSGPGIVKKLFKDEFTVSVDDMPKFIVPTNYSFEIKDGGLRRRIIYLEFTDYFTRSGGVDVHFGCHFPKGWELTDWTGYDNFIAESIRIWLAGGLKLNNPSMTEGGWSKQFEQTWGQVITGIIADNIDRWIEREWIPNDDFRADIDGYFRENNTAPSYRPAMNRIYQGLGEYCRHYGLDFNPSIQHRNEIGVSSKHKWFGKTPF